jgi:hypothetical protein
VKQLYAIALNSSKYGCFPVLFVGLIYFSGKGTNYDLRSSGILDRVDEQFNTDVSGQPIDHICNGQAAQDRLFFDYLTL